MKKTLLGALAFVLMLSTVLAGAVMTSAATVEANANVGEVYAVAENQPIIVDGHLDRGYLESPALLIDMRVRDIPGLYTQGVFRFAWSPSENAIYCHVIINDVEVSAPDPLSPWESDSVELFLHRGDDNLCDFQSDKWETLTRGRQYRIDGYTKAPTCYVEPERITYTWNEQLGRLDGGSSACMVTDDINLFGWDVGGWGASIFDDGGTKGYAVEFKITYPKTEQLTAGEAFRFDVQVNDRFNSGASQQVYYHSAVRVSEGVSRGRDLAKYDHFVLSDTPVDNNGHIANDQLGSYGRADASTMTTGDLLSKPWVSTVRSSYIRSIRTGTLSQINTNTNTSSTTTNDNTQPSGGGCGGAIAAGSSVIVLAMVGATGFFAFRHRRNGDDE